MTIWSLCADSSFAQETPKLCGSEECLKLEKIVAAATDNLNHLTLYTSLRLYLGPSITAVQQKSSQALGALLFHIACAFLVDTSKSTNDNNRLLVDIYGGSLFVIIFSSIMFLYFLLKFQKVYSLAFNCSL